MAAGRANRCLADALYLFRLLLTAEAAIGGRLVRLSCRRGHLKLMKWAFPQLGEPHSPDAMSGKACKRLLAASAAAEAAAMQHSPSTSSATGSSDATSEAHGTLSNAGMPQTCFPAADPCRLCRPSPSVPFKKVIPP